MARVQADTTTQTSSEHAYAECFARQGVAEISDAVAVTIAAWWQSPGYEGRAFAALASGLPVDYDDLRADIRAAERQAYTPDDVTALDMLGQWAIARHDIYAE